jgi:hypothetical protein
MIDDNGRNTANFTFRGTNFNSKLRSIVDFPLFGTQKITIDKFGDPLSNGFEVGNFGINPTTGGLQLNLVESYGPIPGDPTRKMQLVKTMGAIIYPDGTLKNSFEPPTISLFDLKGVFFAVYLIIAIQCVLFIGSAAFIIKNKQIIILKVSSWYINSFVLFALCLIVCSTIPTYLPPNFVNCTSRILVFSFGFTFIGSLLFLKNYRVWRIFCSKAFKQSFMLTDKHIILISLGICAVDMALVIIWMATLKPGPNLTYNGVEFSSFCDAAATTAMNPLAWVLCMAIKVPIILVGAAISVMNRNIIDQKFNESVVTGMSN